MSDSAGPLFGKLLIANRGEIALRIHRAARELGIRTVAVHSTADASAMHVRLADEAICIGPPRPADSYLCASAILAAAEVSHADAIHPGYGFLSENARFARMVEAHRITWVGPAPEHIETMGDKLIAKRTAARLGLPLVPGSEGPVQPGAAALAQARRVGFPVLVKAAAGGGGRGMKLAPDEASLDSAIAAARAEAASAFGDGTVYLEKYLGHPRHIEFQVFGDGRGNAIHLGERDCSLQRRHQKVVEEAPSPALSAEARAAMGRRCAEAVAALGYRGAGTLEFLWQDGEFYFIEMNTRLQVEHPVTEMVTGLDLVHEQLRVAAGLPLSLAQHEVKLDGHAIEARVTAENPLTFAPSPGRVTGYHAPGGPGVRVDSALYAGDRVQPHYDSLIAKLIVHAPTRAEALARMARALEEYVVEGVATTLPLHQRIVREPDFRSGEVSIKWLEEWLARERPTR